MFTLTKKERFESFIAIFSKIAIFTSIIIITYNLLPMPWNFIVTILILAISRFIIKPTTTTWINFRIVCGSPNFDDTLMILTDTRTVNDVIAEKRKEIINSDDKLPDATLNASDRFDALVHIVSPLALLLIPVICFCWFGFICALISFIICISLIKISFSPSLRVLGSYIRIFGAPTPDIYLMTFAFPEKVNTIVLSRQRQTHSF